MTAKVFFSYSHRDEELRNELEIHLSTLKHQKIIETWHDRRIGSGKELDKEIDSNLEEADIVLLLVSPYFIASSYCYEIEMQRALEKHEKGEARVIPVILHPCDWHSTPFGKVLAMPTDGKPISKYPNPHDAFLEVAKAVRDAAKNISQENDTQPMLPSVVSSEKKKIIQKPRSSNLRVKKDFSEREKDEFLEKSYEYIANHFEGSLEELESRNNVIKTKFKRIDANHFTATIYKNDKVASECKIWLGGRRSFSNGIAYSTNTSSNDNSLNESMSVENDGYDLFLKPMGMSFIRQGENGRGLLSQQGAAEYFWEILINPLQ
ncbi:MAG: toll/interleukin-1 receptor domain-containing protein [Candidatus Competibacteraceae bacterium]|nr:MAG: toll/interleukin-1 receptor domain-containing protein [Candidatus Competibacteraceae bacterium]